MVLDCEAIDVIEERGGFLIVARSEDPGDRSLPPSSKGAIMIDVHLGGTLCRVTGPDTTDMTTVINTDAKLFGVPTFLINFITRKIANYFLSLARNFMLLPLTPYLDVARLPGLSEKGAYISS